MGSVIHANAAGLAAGASYNASAKIRLPQGTDGPYYIYVISDAMAPTGPQAYAPQAELVRSGTNDQALGLYENSVFEGARNDNNLGRATLNVTYREPDLQVDTVTVSDPNPSSGQQITVTWTVTNRGTREVRTNAWFDGVYLSRDGSLDDADYPLVDRGSQAEALLRVRQTAVGAGAPPYLKPGESYTNSATFTLPESIGGDFQIIVKADTATFRDTDPLIASTIRDGLYVLEGLSLIHI